MSQRRTTTHNYPQEEVTAMIAFYDRKRCIITLSENGVQWAHIQETTISSNTRQLEWMLQRKLRQDRHPAHAAEVRENIVPMNSIDHQSMDSLLPKATIFLHEDIVARTLGYERELKQWRQSEVQAGRDDPGRPEYEDVFLNGEGIQPTTPHRWHTSVRVPFTIRYPPGQRPIVYSAEQCPGAEPPNSDPFPVIDTLLSIPFSLLHTAPRLSGLMTGSIYRRDLVFMALEVIQLWDWDPDIPENPPAATTNEREHGPLPIYHPSRSTTTIAAMRPPHPSAPTTPVASAAAPCTSVVQARSDTYIGGEKDKEHQMYIDITPASSLHRARSASYVSWEMESTPSNSENNADDALHSTLDVVSLKSRVVAWLDDIDKGAMDSLPDDMYDTTPFASGDIGGMTANDALMVRGLIHPSVYIQFFDLSLYARQ